jgi:hypothetical protein
MRGAIHVGAAMTRWSEPIVYPWLAFRDLG